MAFSWHPPVSKVCLLFFVLSISFAQESQDSIFLDEEAFSIMFLGRSLNFYLNEEFSARKIATEFCNREAGFDEEDASALNKTIQPENSFKNHVVAVRDLIENVVASSLGPDRIEAAFQGKDPSAYMFVNSVCNDFPKNHDMPYQRLVPRSLPMNIIDGAAQPLITHSSLCCITSHTHTQQFFLVLQR